MNSKKNSGGSRQGSGAKLKYGEKTVLMSTFWCPESKVTEMKKIISEKLSENIVNLTIINKNIYNVFINNCFYEIEKIRNKGTTFIRVN